MSGDSQIRSQKTELGEKSMGFLDEWITDNIAGWFGDIFLLLCAIGSLIGVLLVCYGIIRVVLKFSGFIQVKSYGMGPLILGFVLVLMFGWEFGLEYFQIYPM